MKLHRWIPIAAFLAVSAVTIPTSASAQVGFSITISNTPPPVRDERLPPPRAGYIWAPGFWDWGGRHHVWVAGHWERARHGYFYDAPRWEQRGDRWQLSRGGWQHGDRGAHRGGDRDHDGVPNQFDRDRDGDGVPNNRDRRPNDPRRY